MGKNYTIEFKTGLLAGISQDFKGPTLTLGRAQDVDIPVVDFLEVDAKYLVEIAPLGLITIAALHKPGAARKSVGRLGKILLIDDASFCISGVGSHSFGQAARGYLSRRRLIAAAASCVIFAGGIWALAGYFDQMERIRRTASFDAAVAHGSSLGMDGVFFERVGQDAVNVRGVVAPSKQAAFDATLVALAAHFDIESRVIGVDDAKDLIRGLIGPALLSVNHDRGAKFIAHTVAAPEFTRVAAALLHEELGKFGAHVEIVHVEGPAKTVSLEDILRGSISSNIKFQNLQYLVLDSGERVYAGDQLPRDYQLMRWSWTDARISAGGHHVELSLKKTTDRP